jgi:hypothetical protein
MSLDVIFAYVVGVVAGVAIIGALAFALVWLVWEWCAIRRTLTAHRRQAPDPSFWRDRGALIPTLPQRRP